MQRKELKIAMKNINDTILLESSPYVLFKELKSKGSNDINDGVILKAYKDYIKNSHNYGLIEHKLMEIIGLEFLNDTQFWATLLRKSEKRPATIAAAYQKIKSALYYLPKFIQLLDWKHDQNSNNLKKEKNSASVSTFTIIMIEENQLSTPNRIILALQSVDGLYRACASIMGRPENDLSVTACDSGNDKSFEFLGIAKVVDCVKRVILSFWDIVVYFRDHKSGRNFESVALSLPILEDVESMKDAGKIEPERAELIKRQVIDAITKFGAAGVTIPEIEEFTVYNPRKLLMPEQKLLVETNPFDSDMQ